jgi:tetrahydromethanopterin S-methyltransferase subunit B
LEQGTGQTNHVYPIKEIIEYFKDELLKRDNKIEELTSELEEYRKNKRKSAKPKEAKLKSVPGKQATQ